MKKIYLLLTVTLLFNLAQANSLLQNKVTLNVKKQPLETVLDEISKQTGLHFSYNASAIDASQLVSVEVKDVSAEKTLRLLLGEKYEYKLTRRHIILKKSQVKIAPIQLIENKSQLIDNQEIAREIEECEYIKNQVYVKNFCYSDSGTALGDCPIITNDKKNEVMKKHLAILTLAVATSSSAVAGQTQDSTLSAKEQLAHIGKSFSTLVVEAAESTAAAVKIAADELSNQVAQLKVDDTQSTDESSATANEPAVTLKVEAEKQEAENPEAAATPAPAPTPEPATATATPATTPKTDSVRPFLFTIIYPFSFPELQPERHTYNFSLNLLAGYNGGVEGCELGYLANVNRYRMSGFQAAGITNVSMGSVEGLQAAGIANFANHSKSHAQMSGVVNVAAQDTVGVQLTGIVNVAQSAQYQGAGTVNYAYGNGKVQMAGIANLSSKGRSAAQVAGVVNTANTANVQVAGITNAALQSDIQVAGVANASLGKNITQISGIVNVADTSAAQIGGVVNVARKAGTQIGLVNVADTVSGVMVGLVNYARKGGLRQFEVSAGGTSSVNAAFRMGTKKLYTFYEASWDFENEVWRQGLGLGTQITFPRNWGMNIEALHQSVSKNFFEQEGFNGLTQLRVVGFKQFAKHFTLFAGPALYVYNSDREGSKPINFKTPYTLYYDHSGRFSTDIWIGATVGVRF